ncbi:MAG: glutathione peroxidase, partial [Pseudomonadota bacterium]
FNQELASNEAVKEFCEVNYSLTVPMTEVTEVTGDAAHPFYQWLREAHDFTPRWNFNKVLLDGEGRFVDAWGSSVRPTSTVITKKVEAALPSGS